MNRCVSFCVYVTCSSMSFLGVWNHVFHQNWDFGVIIFSKFFPALSLSPPSEAPTMRGLILMMSHRSPRLCFLYSIFLLRLDTCQFISLQVCWLFLLPVQISLHDWDSVFVKSLFSQFSFSSWSMVPLHLWTSRTELMSLSRKFSVLHLHRQCLLIYLLPVRGPCYLVYCQVS